MTLWKGKSGEEGGGVNEITQRTMAGLRSVMRRRFVVLCTKAQHCISALDKQTKDKTNL